MARELPAGIEWPRYKDGGLLEIGDIVLVCGKYEELLQAAGREESEEEGEDMLKLGNIETFKDASPTKEQVVKIAEETCEVFSAWEAYRSTCAKYEVSNLLAADILRECARDDLLNECADVIQAVSNLIAGLGVTDFTEHIKACEDRNRRRGRI